MLTWTETEIEDRKLQMFLTGFPAGKNLPVHFLMPAATQQQSLGTRLHLEPVFLRSKLYFTGTNSGVGSVKFMLC